jgi:hypothetical protein
MKPTQPSGQNLVARYLAIAASLASVFTAHAAVTLSADGAGNTYELIESKNFGVENPDCKHHVRHIREVFDAELHEWVFAFDIHRNLDDDRCGATDRQRVEIKTSPVGTPEQQLTKGETAHYRWKFKLPAGFQPSPSFTHIHQIKAENGDDDAPILTISARAGSPDMLEVIHVAPQGQSGSGVKAKTQLAPFIDTCVEAYVRILNNDAGSIEVVLKRLSDGKTLLSWTSGTLDTWRVGASYNRGKWGIYRSLNNAAYLRDETVLFADWCVSESGASACPSAIKPPCATPVVMPYLRAKGGTWQKTAALTVAAGTQVTFGPQPIDGKWQWSGCGTSGSAREQTVVIKGSCVAKAVYTNACGASDQQDFKLTVKKP